MNLHLHKNDVLRLICDKYNLAYDIIQDENATQIHLFMKDPGIIITWEGSRYEIQTQKE